MNAAAQQMLDAAYETFDGSDDMREYMDRHGVQSLGILTVYDDETADLIASHLESRIRGKVVVEIGAGLGLLACHIAQYARHVYAIEANPVWASCFAVALLKHKPANCTYILGAASEMNGLLRADVAIFCTHSGAAAMRQDGLLFAPSVVDVYAEVLGDKLNDGLRALRQVGVPDPVATTARLAREITP